MHPKWVAVHPVVLAMTACLAMKVREVHGTISGTPTSAPSINYLLRMGLFDYLQIDPGKEIHEHEESGRFVPLTQIKNSRELKAAIIDLVALLHAPASVADSIKYVFSEMVRNSIEHAYSSVGAIVCAQYYTKSQRIAIGIADAGQGVFTSMRRNHGVRTSQESIRLALQPGITGTTYKLCGNETNAGAGLFFTKSIATLSRNQFFLYSGESMFRLMRTRKGNEPKLHADPVKDLHKFEVAPDWQGTVVGIDLNIEPGAEFEIFMDEIRNAYSIDVERKKDYSKRIKFAP
jgi:anti-sigma regulatory factor (Ser/Thr protein kinase)